MKYLVQTVETYRVDTETEAKELINEAKNMSEFELIKYVTERKEIKEKKEYVGEYFKVSLTKKFNDIKEPENRIKITYEEDI